MRNGTDGPGAVEASRDAVRRFNRRILNPTMMKLAGRRHWYASVIRHEGRRSGREYATPVVAVPTTGGGFVVPLPYGEGVDWLRNVLAAGRATVETGGAAFEVVRPEVVDVAAVPPLPAERHRLVWRALRIRRCLVLRRAEASEEKSALEYTDPVRQTRSRPLAKKKTWEELGGRQKTAVLVATSVQVSLLLTALIDIYRRPREEIRGGKWAWTAASFVSFVGPISYILFGRRRQAARPPRPRGEPTRAPREA